MKVLKYPIISIVIFLALGIIAGNYFKPPVEYLLVFTVVSSIFVGLTFWQSTKSLVQRPHFCIAVYLLSASVGLLAYSLHYALNHTSHYSHHFNNAEVPVITGTISERLKPNEFSEKYYFEVNAIDKQPASGKLLIIVPKDSVNRILHAGQKLLIADELKPISRSLNPYQFDYGKYMAGLNVFHQVKLKDNYYKTGLDKNFDYYIDALRNTLTGSFGIHQYAPETNNMIKALLLGQRQDMDKETTDNYTKAGVVHILAISGLHIAVLFYILNLLFKPLRRLKNGRLVSLALILGFLWLFAFVSGLSASVVRSVVMFSFVSLGVYFNRDSNIYNSLAVSMLFLLLAKPMFLFDVGFQLSYAAVFAIVWLQPIYKKVRVSKYKAVNYITDTVLISLVAQIGVLPLSLYYFNQFPLLFLLANVVVVPLSTLVLIVGLIVLLLNFIWADAAIMAGKFLELIIDAMNLFTSWIASFDRLVITNIPFNMFLNIVLYAVIIAFALWLYRKSYRRTTALLVSAIIFQGLYIGAILAAKNNEELVIFHNWGDSLLAIKNKDAITVLSTDSVAAENRNIIAYNKGNFNLDLKTAPLQNVIWFNNQKILVLDSLGVYDTELKPDVLLLTQSPKVNLQRALELLQPKQVIADATNYKSYTARWAATCSNKKIPFHATAEKGFYIIK